MRGARTMQTGLGTHLDPTRAARAICERVRPRDDQSIALTDGDDGRPVSVDIHLGPPRSGALNHAPVTSCSAEPSTSQGVPDVRGDQCCEFIGRALAVESPHAHAVAFLAVALKVAA